MPKLGMEKVRKEQVIEAAKNCIIKKGISNLSMKDIAAEAKISTGIIYHYFKNKEDVLLQVLKESFRQSHELVLNTLEPLQTPSEKLISHLKNINSVPKENPDFYVLFLNYLGEANHHSEIRKILIKFLRNLKKYSDNYLDEDFIEGNETVKNFSTIIYALGLGLGIMWAMDDQLYDIDEMEQSLTDLFSNYIDKEKGR